MQSLFFLYSQFHGSQRTKHLEIFEISWADSNTFPLLYITVGKVKGLWNCCGLKIKEISLTSLELHQEKWQKGDKSIYAKTVFVVTKIFRIWAMGVLTFRTYILMLKKVWFSFFENVGLLCHRARGRFGRGWHQNEGRKERWWIHHKRTKNVDYKWRCRKLVFSISSYRSKSKSSGIQSLYWLHHWTRHARDYTRSQGLTLFQ